MVRVGTVDVWPLMRAERAAWSSVVWEVSGGAHFLELSDSVVAPFCCWENLRRSLAVPSFDFQASFPLHGITLGPLPDGDSRMTPPLEETPTTASCAGSCSSISSSGSVLKADFGAGGRGWF